MAASVNLARFYLQDTRALPMNIWVMDGEVPYPEWSDADMVFVLNPPPLDIPLLAEVWKEGRTLILVSTKLDSGLMEAGLHPLKELFALPNNATAEVLMHLKQRQASVFFLSFQRRRPWYTNWLPQLERDSFLVDGARFVFLFDEYVPYEGSFEFDDTYRRTSLKECTFEQSTSHFRHVLEGLPYTELQDSQMKRSLFQGVFPFYTGQSLGPDVRFAWQGTLEPVRTTVIGAEIRQHAEFYALAIACLSEVGAAFTLLGQHHLYLKLMGDVLRLHNGQIRVGTFTPAQVALLRREHPFLYLHMFYQVPNQCIVAMMDELRDSLQNTAIIAAATDLLHRLVTRESDLHFVKRSYELTALSGTLCQLKTSAARYHTDRVRLLDAKEDGLRAVQYARPADKSRDMNYWMHAVLTDWVLFPDQVQGDPTRADAEYARMVQYLSDHLPQASENYYDLIMAYLAAAVEAVCRHDMQIRDLIGAHAGGPAWLTSLFERADDDGRKDGSYALCLAAGYAALLCLNKGLVLKQQEQ
jgi:hypothetical protein